MQTLLDNEPAWRLGAFLSIFVAVAIAERLAPRRTPTRPVGKRWVHNLALTFVNTGIARIVLPMAPVAFAVWVSEQGGGLFGAMGLSGMAAVVLGVVLLDFVIYLQHVVFHAVPTLWRLHRMHHADVDYDVTTGARFHPIEILLSLGIKFAAIAALGVPPVAVVLFEIILNGMAMFNHGNLRLPGVVDQVLRWFVVTPDMHRVHHSVRTNEMHRNFGFNLSIWDRIFGTYTAEPEGGQEGFTIGLPTFRDPSEVAIWSMWTLPFRDEPAASEAARDDGDASLAA